MKKIIITGALGYIGMELCKLYSGESWKNKIVAIDINFFSDRVKQLTDWGIQFIQGDILNKPFIQKNLEQADVVFHLAGVTNVAYTKFEANSEHDKKILSVGIEGTVNVLESIPNSCKLIFPSTHVVYEGFKKIEKNIDESEATKPVLSYAKSKNQNEIDIKKNHKNFVILRLGSVYGFSLDSTRINIMPNLFAKISSQDSTINLFQNGRQLKSLVNIIDVVRSMKFFEENEKIKNETFHIINENTTVKKVAQICKKINPNVKIQNTKNKVPNNGYTLSNKKILKTGFKFLYNLEFSLKEMINFWKFEVKDKDLEYVFKGSKEFKDSRGVIKNYELPEQINWIGYIESKKNTVRANHYHPIQEQKCMLAKGQFISVYKDLLGKNSNIVTHVVNEGDLIVTKPNVAHAMIFTKDTIFLNLVRGDREHENYGITHTIPYLLVDENTKKNILFNYRFDCRSCGNKNLKRILSLGMHPLANKLISNPKLKVPTYPLEVNFCDKCYNCQLSISIKSSKLFNNYNYVSSTAKSFVKHFSLAAKKYIKKFNLKKNSLIVDIGSNDGIALLPFKDCGFKNLLGIEPAKNIANLANNKGIKTINSYFNKKTVRKIKKKANLILASNVFAHSDDLKSFAKNMLDLLKIDGSIVIEVQYLVDMIKKLTFDNIYHEHFNYWTLTSLQKFFQNFGAKIVYAEKIVTHGGSLRIYVSKKLKEKIHPSVKKILIEEEKFGIKDFKTYQNFANKIYSMKENVIKNFIELKKNKIIVGYGAPAKATVLLNYFGLDNSLIDFIIEDNKLKHNKYIPVAKIPIKSKNFINKVNYKNFNIVVLAWNYFDEIVKNNSQYKSSFVNLKKLISEQNG